MGVHGDRILESRFWSNIGIRTESLPMSRQSCVYYIRPRGFSLLANVARKGQTWWQSHIQDSHLHLSLAVKQV